jgi:hypothetical protein
MNAKDEELVSMMKDLHITSEPAEFPGSPAARRGAAAANSQPMPRLRYTMKRQVEKEPGKLTPAQMMALQHAHATNPKRWDAEQLARHFQLPLESTQLLLKYTQAPVIFTTGNEAIAAFEAPEGARVIDTLARLRDAISERNRAKAAADALAARRRFE